MHRIVLSDKIRIYSRYIYMLGIYIVDRKYRNKIKVYRVLVLFVYVGWMGNIVRIINVGNIGHFQNCSYILCKTHV